MAQLESSMDEPVVTTASKLARASAAGDVTAATVPPECPDGVCGAWAASGERATAPQCDTDLQLTAGPAVLPADKLWGMNRINIKPLWQLPNLVPLASAPKPGSIIDTEVDMLAHNVIVGQVDMAKSATFNAKKTQAGGVSIDTLPSFSE